MAKFNRQSGTTARGEARYAWLRRPDKKYDPAGPGNYKLELYLPDDEETLEFLSNLERTATEWHESEAPDKSPQPYPWTKQEDGTWRVRFQQKAEIGGKNGEPPVPMRPKVLDSHNRPADIEIGNGSIVRIGFQMVSYVFASKFGVRLSPRIVQVISHKPLFAETPESYGLEEVEDGFVLDADPSPSAPVSEEGEEIPFEV